MVGFIEANMQESTFTEIRTLYHSYQFDKWASLTYEKFKRNSDAELILMDSIFKLKSDVNNALNDILDKQTDPNIKSMIDAKLYSTFIQQWNEISFSTKSLKIIFETRFSDDERKLWKKLHEISEKKFSLLEHQMKMINIGSEKLDETVKVLRIDAMQSDLNEIKNDLKTIQNDVALIKGASKSQFQNTFTQAVANMNRVHPKIYKLIGEFGIKVEKHVIGWSGISDMFHRFLAEISKMDHPTMAEDDYKNLATKFNDVNERQQQPHPPPMKMLQNNVERIAKANEIIKSLNEINNSYQTVAKSKTILIQRQLHFVGASTIEAFVSVFRLFIYYPKSFGLDESKFLTFISENDYGTKLTADQLQIMKTSLENVLKLGRSSHEIIWNILTEFKDFHLKEIGGDSRETGTNLMSASELNKKFYELFHKLTMAAKLNKELLESQADAFKTVCDDLGLK